MSDDNILDLPEEPAKPESLWGKFWRLTESNLFWGGGIGVMLAAYAFLLTGAITFSIVLLILAWLIISVSIYRHKFFEDKSKSIQATIQTLILMGLAVAFIVIWLSLRPKTPSSEVEVVLVAPKEQHKYRWIPLKRLAIDQGSAATKDFEGVPKFQLKNLSDSVVTNIRITWRITDPTPIKAVFLSSEHFKRYNAEIDPADSFAPYHLSNDKGEGTQTPASDEEAANIPYVQVNEDGVDVPMPFAIAYGYGFRLAATVLRPDMNKGSGMTKTIGPPMDVTLVYSQSGKDYRRKFHIESSVLAISDNTTAYVFGGYIDLQYWSPDNLRATVTFIVSSRD